jgi:hypothetical protein
MHEERSAPDAAKIIALRPKQKQQAALDPEALN